MSAAPFAVDLLLGQATCAACGDDLRDGDLAATVDGANANAPWCLACVRELLRARADEAVRPTALGVAAPSGSSVAGGGETGP